MGIDGAATRSCNDDVGPKAFSHIAVIGGGAWGTALALTAHRAGRRVTLWAREKAAVEAVAGARRNPFLPSAELPEEIVVTDGHVRNPSFTDYLIPTILDMPPMKVQVLEYADPHAPYGVRGVGEPPTISSGPAVAAAVRDACGRPLRRVPIRPEHITGT